MAVALLGQVRPLVTEDVVDLGIRVQRLADGDLAAVDVDLRSRYEQVSGLVGSLLAQKLEELCLVGEDRVVLEPRAVVPEQLLAQEHGWPRHGKDMRSVDLVDVVHRALVLGLALELGDVLLRVLREVVDHRPPDRSRHLREVRIGRPERQQLVHIQRVGVVLVQDAGRAVIHRQ